MVLARRMHLNTYVGEENDMDHSLTENGNNSVLQVGGELDALSSPELRPTLELLAHDLGRNITVDLSRLQLIDSSGLGALISLYKQTYANGGTVSFVGVADQPLVLFKLLRLDRAFGLN
jgi:anti-sigma B factor antagonist